MHKQSKAYICTIRKNLRRQIQRRLPYVWRCTACTPWNMSWRAVWDGNWYGMCFRNATGTITARREVAISLTCLCRERSNGSHGVLSMLCSARLTGSRTRWKWRWLWIVELDGSIEYFKEKNQLLDEAAGKDFRSNGQAYYWISHALER